MTFIPSAYQQRIFDFVATGRGSAVVIAVAGSGKTTTVMKSLPLIPESKSVQLFAFNATIAKELKERLAGLAVEHNRPFSRFRAGTFHSVGYGAVLKYLNMRDLKPDGNKLRKLVRSHFSDIIDEIYGSFISNLVSLAKGEGIGALVPNTDERWYNLIQHHDLFLEVEEATEEEAVKLARELLEHSNNAAKKGNIDFDDMLYLPLLWKLRLWQNDFVFVDEAQDTNPVRRAIAKLALRPGGRLIAVGDPCQAIYGFTGASHDAIELIKKEFNAIELPLTVSYRCAQSIIETAKPLVPHLEASANAPMGKVESLFSREALTQLDEHDAILCRQTKPLIALAYQLIAANRGCTVLGKEIGTGLANLVKKMRALTLAGLLDRLDAYRSREVAKFTAKGEEQKAEAVADRVACLETIIEHLDEKARTIPALLTRIDGLFSDTNGVLTLCTIHKAKGKEWNRVGILAPELMPSKWARQDWQQQQESNIMYVAYTRAKSHLIFIQSQEGS